jgi:hypothetical protein
MRTLAIALVFSLWLSPSLQAGDGRFLTGSPATTRNDDGCDLSNLPAATLLIPYFEVDFSSPQSVAQTTLFTITNVSRVPQIARVTLWTDRAYPELTFNIFLTGYDVQAINLYDVFARGIIAPPSGASNTTTPGTLSAANGSNPNFLATAAGDCSRLPGAIPANLVADVRNAFTLGTTSTCATVGLKHANAIGYITIDVMATCGFSRPQDDGYFNELLYDNVLMGDYQQINPNAATGNYAAGNPMVHIRAIPEGGAAAATPGTNLPYTFYNRLLPAGTDRTRDRRQPLPSAFAARYIQGGPGAFNTNLKIWREATSGSSPACDNYAKNSEMDVVEMVRFDEHENPTVWVLNSLVSPPVPIRVTLPAASSTPTSSNLYPAMSTSGDIAGWIYVNANNLGSTAYSAATGRDFVTGSSTKTGSRQSQNWVVVSMSAEGRYSVDFDALALGNGCSPAPPASNASSGTGLPLGPLPDVNP